MKPITKPRGEKILVLAFCLMLAFGFTHSLAQHITPEVYEGLKYRYIGPPGNRTSAVVGEPGNHLVYYIGASSGGIWKTTDGGTHWLPIFDEQPAQSIGALAIAPSDYNVIWAGTGEAFIRSNVSIGNGMYKSTDAGKTWTHMGLDLTGRIGRVVIDPRDPDTVLVAALGHCHGPQKERGVFRTTDGGKSWQHVLFVDENTGCFEIAANPGNPRILLAGMWPVVIRTWGRESGGPNGGIWKSTDGGISWKRLKGSGLPDPPLGKVGLAFAPSDPQVVYALIETGQPNRGVLWRSADSGDTWKLVSSNRLLNERPHYASRLLVNPADENEVYFAANSISRTLDGGYTSETVPWSGDCHDLWADPFNPDRIIVSDDGGAIITLNRGKSWRRINLPIAQMYHVAVDTQIPYNVYGGRQDGPAYRGPGMGYGSWWLSTESQWHATAGGECGFIIPDPVEPHIVWGGSYNAQLERANYKTGHIHTVQVWPESIYGSHAAAAKYRFNWTFPIHISPHNHNNKIYVGSQHVHQTLDGGRSWQIISPDLSTNDPSKMVPSGGLTRDNLAVEYGCVIFAIAESPVEAGCIWAGTNDGLLHITLDGGESWQDVTKNIPRLPPWGTMSNIEPSRYHAGTAYITVDFHQMNNRDPFVYKTSDYGKTWKSLSATIPKSVFSYCHWLHEDPVKRNLLYLGTENAIYISFNDGRKWLPLQNNLPHAPVHHMVVQEQFNDLVVGTYGRGFWILDDITPLQQLTDAVLQSPAHLFHPRQAFRLHSRAGGPNIFPHTHINYYLKSTPKDPVKIAILDDQGEVIQTLEGSQKIGINRVTWNLRHPGARPTKLRTPPPGNPRVVEEKRFVRRWIRDGWYPLLSWGGFTGFRGFLVAPGTYTIRMTVDGTSHERELVVKKDPNSEGTVEDIRKQVALQKAVRADLNTVSDMISQIEWMRKQLQDLRKMLDSTKQEEICRGIEDFEKKLKGIEGELFQPAIAEGDTKSFRYPQKLYFKLSVLAENIATSVDFAPNRQQREVHDMLKKLMAEQKARFSQILETDLPAFNIFLKEKHLAGVLVPKVE